MKFLDKKLIGDENNLMISNVINNPYSNSIDMFIVKSSMTVGTIK